MLGTGATDFRVLHAKLALSPQLPATCASQEVYTTQLSALVMPDTIHPAMIHVLNAKFVHCKPQQATLARREGQQILYNVSAIRDIMEMVRFAMHVDSAAPMQL
jgi:hypothetical protein